MMIVLMVPLQDTDDLSPFLVCTLEMFRLLHTGSMPRVPRPWHLDVGKITGAWGPASGRLNL